MRNALMFLQWEERAILFPFSPPGIEPLVLRTTQYFFGCIGLVHAPPRLQVCHEAMLVPLLANAITRSFLALGLGSLTDNSGDQSLESSLTHILLDFHC